MARYQRLTDFVRSLGIEKGVHAIAGSAYAVDTDEPVFHLTFDDGPNREVTPDVLDALDEFGAKATFFVLTSRAQEHPELVAETMARGHLVGLHTRTHTRLSDCNFSQLVDEVYTARKDLEEVTGVPVEWFRAPYGAEGARSLPVIRFAKMKSLNWSVDTHDWKGLDAASPIGGWRERIGSGGVALLHDVPSGETVGDDDANGFVRKGDLTRALLRELRDRELAPVSLPELLATGPTLRRAKLR
ncbi:MAG TPA: polysaccharide deacetylase family protein [Acidimicrobiia bacterium]|nr:polysaccharide deacetylase family protein [Acidimicrobiia bacterium]